MTHIHPSKWFCPGHVRNRARNLVPCPDCCGFRPSVLVSAIRAGAVELDGLVSELEQITGGDRDEIEADAWQQAQRDGITVQEVLQHRIRRAVRSFP